mgnify:FL=1|tara:strand:- start:14 stop:628 length:615 start_codon:yes stop_codon:yes gene_type:complete
MDSLRLSGTLTIPDGGVSSQTRATILKQESDAIFPIDLTTLRVHDAYHTNLPGTAATDDLALVGGTFGTAPPVVSAGDLKAAGATTRYARFQMVLPECYDAGETVTLSVYAGIVTTIADVSCTLDVECYKLDKITGIGSDLCATAATTINSLVLAAIPFTITPSGLVAGDTFDVRIAIACNDAATVTAVTPTVSAIDLLADIKG